MARVYLGILLSITLPVQALTFQTRMEDVQWSVAGDQFECRLSQTVTGYGEAVFVRRAGERPTFELKPWSNLMQPGPAQLYNEAPLWRPGTRSRLLGQAQVQDGPVALVAPEQQAGLMLAGLAEGLHPTIKRSSFAGSEPVRVVVSSVGYQAAWNDFQQCATGLLPINFDQASRSVVSFATGGSKLDDAARQLLDTVLIYIEADDQIKGIQLDGHSDNVGNRLDNRELSRQRVLAVQNYLIERGVDESKFSLRFHGDSFPVASNRSAEGRAQNRRVTLRLEKH
ncbi:OmpA family protein [Halopseudomonas phragmitis]|uniref:OmpA-like domain-containing protein n=1 Tax=Halopseudomonas phragmitis TaxID=1931241 RepID=A0A1V0B8C1_9GAMM|nr:OmpA family protein [Halopseudomonas phragmitis]AQZ96034.1 hypothetical protein BVH74_15305 [Halopseudomonas phragmitis]